MILVISWIFDLNKMYAPTDKKFTKLYHNKLYNIIRNTTYFTYLLNINTI